jgi:hypothetical protein
MKKPWHKKNLGKSWNIGDFKQQKKWETQDWSSKQLDKYMETWTFFFTSPQRRNLGLTSLNLGNLRIWAAKNRKIWLAKMVWDFKTRPAKLGWPSVRQTRQASKSPTKKNIFPQNSF